MTMSKQLAPACRMVTQYQSGGEKVFEIATADAKNERSFDESRRDSSVRPPR